MAEGGGNLKGSRSVEGTILLMLIYGDLLHIKK